MKFFPRLSIRYKLLLMVLVIGGGAVALVGFLGEQTGKTALRSGYLGYFANIRATKSYEVESYFRRIEKQATTFSEDLMVVDAMKSFTSSFHQLESSKLTPQQRQELVSFYAARFVPTLAKNMGKAEPAVSYVPANPAAAYLQYHYIVKNPYPEGQRKVLVNAGDGSRYSAVHARYQKLFSNFAQSFGYSDLALVDTDSGDVVYTLEKEPDFASNVLSGPFQDTNFSQASRESRKEAYPDFVKIVDFKAYPPSAGEPAAFVVSPIFDGGKHIGDLLFGLPVIHIDRMMTENYSWKQKGMGNTGENFLVGPDFLMRSNERIFLESPEQYLSDLRALHVPESKLDIIRELKTTILQQRIHNASVEAALRGESGIKLDTDFLGYPSVISYSPLDIDHLGWALITQIHRDEVVAPLTAFRRRLTIWTVTIILAALAIVLLMARTFGLPIRALMEGARRFGAGDMDVQVPVLSQDEFGMLTKTFNEMARSISEKNRVIRQKNEENERLLLNILPSPIAERLKTGEKSIADGFAEVTVLFADLVGFTAFSAVTPPEKLVSFLNDLFRRYDEAAISHGIEKIKTIGDCYMAVSGLPNPRQDHARAMLEMALDMLHILRRFDEEHAVNMQIRIGINTGPVVAGVIGASKFIYDLWGDTVNLASRMESTGVAGAIQVSQSVYELLRHEYPFEDRGMIQIKGKGAMPAWVLREENVKARGGIRPAA